jgi:hypothetical protein
MASLTELLIDVLDDAFDRVGWQGPMNLVNTLKPLSLEQLAYTETTAGYTIWGVVLHCAYWKWVVTDLLWGHTLKAFPRSPKDFPALPGELTEAAWRRDFDLLLEQHRLLKEAVTTFPEERWREISMPPDDPMTYAKRVYGVAAHDVYHTAQIRNMGVPEIR